MVGNFALALLRVCAYACMRYAGVSHGAWLRSPLVATPERFVAPARVSLRELNGLELLGSAWLHCWRHEPGR